MSLYIDTNVVRAEIDRRYELAGVDPYARNPHHHSHVRDLPARPLGLHPLAAFVARLLRGPATGSPTRAQHTTAVAAGGPRHS